MTDADSANIRDQMDPFRLFKQECKNILTGAYSGLQAGQTALPKIDIASTLDDPPNEEFGHLASSISFELARVRRTKPMMVALELVNEARKTRKFELVESVSAAEPGYVNFKANIPALTRLTLEAVFREGGRYGLLETDQPQRVIVEHTSANPARPIHIGTSKNAIFGDALARILSARRHNVQTRFYIDDTGRQVAQMAYGFKLDKVAGRMGRCCGRASEQIPRRIQPHQRPHLERPGSATIRS